MLIPIGIRENKVQRWPWVTIVLLALNIGVFFMLRPMQVRADRAMGMAFVHAFKFYSQHPYVDPPQELISLLPSRYKGAFDKARKTYLDGQGAPPADVLAKDNARMKELIGEFLDKRSRTVEWRFGLRRDDSRPLAYISYTFIHEGYWHLFGNMLFLLLTGPFLEDVYGRLLFPVLYFSSGVVAGMTQWMKGPETVIVLIGASGAIAGVMGAFFVRLFRSRIRFLFLPVIFLPWINFKFYVPAYVVMPIWFLEQYVLAKLAPGAGVAFWAHVGGFIFGTAVALGVLAGGIEEKYIRPALESKTQWSPDERLEPALDAQAQGRLREAFQLARAVTVQQPDNPDAWQVVLETASAAGQPGMAGAAAARLLALYRRESQPELVAETAQTLLQCCRDNLLCAQGVPPEVWSGLASGAERTGNRLLTATLYQRLLTLHPAYSEAVSIVLKLADIFIGAGKSDAAKQWLEWARSLPSYALSRELVEGKLSSLGGGAPPL